MMKITQSMIQCCFNIFSNALKNVRTFSVFFLSFLVHKHDHEYSHWFYWSSSLKKRIDFGSLESNSYNTVKFHCWLYLNVTKTMETKVLINLNELIILKKNVLTAKSSLHWWAAWTFSASIARRWKRNCKS